MEPRLRPARLEDAPAITALHRSVDGGTISPQASLLERWREGGPWMAVESCAVHLNHMLRTPGRYLLVADLEGQVIGEMEGYLTREAPPFDALHIALLYVHRRYQRMGVGRRLLEGAFGLARELGVGYVTTQPEREAENFYRRMGFSPWLTMWEMQAEATGRSWRWRRPLAEWEQPSERLALRIGRYQCGPQEWDNLFPPIHLPGWSDLPRRVWGLRIGGLPAILALRRQLGDASQADGFAWLAPDAPLRPAIGVLQALAAEEGYAAVDLLLPKEIAERGRREGWLAYQTSLQLWRCPLSGTRPLSKPSPDV